MLPNLYHGQPVRMYGRYKTAGPATIQVKAEVLGSPLEQSLPVTLPATDTKNPEIERMWASHRVERLMAAGPCRGIQRPADEIVRLCEGYSIASQYASFIVLENDAEYQRWKIARRNATRVQRDRQAQLAVREELAQLRRETAGQVGPKGDAQPAGENSSAGKAGKPEFQAMSKKRAQSGQSENARGDRLLRLAGSQAGDGADDAEADFGCVQQPHPCRTSRWMSRRLSSRWRASRRSMDLRAMQSPARPRRVPPAADARVPAQRPAGERAAAETVAVERAAVRAGIDPLTALAAAALAGLGWATRRKARCRRARGRVIGWHWGVLRGLPNAGWGGQPGSRFFSRGEDFAVRQPVEGGPNRCERSTPRRNRQQTAVRRCRGERGSRRCRSPHSCYPPSPLCFSFVPAWAIG